MGRHLQRKNSGTQLEDHHHHHHHPGCMWGILHMLDYHHWHNLKKRLPYKKHGRGRQFRCMGAPKTNSFNWDIEEHQELVESETGHFLDEEDDVETSPSKRSYGKVYTKESISREEEKHKSWAMGFPEKSWLHETDSVHHMEPPDSMFGDISSGWKNPIIVLHKGTDISSTRLHDPALTKARVELNENARKNSTKNDQKRLDSEELKKESKHYQLREYGDVLEIYKVDKELFQNSRRYPDFGTAGQYHLQKPTSKNAKFTKSGSFPAADSRRIKSSEPPSTPVHKQNEVWSLPKGDRFLKDTQMPNLVSSNSIKDCCADDNLCSVIEQESSFSSQNHGWAKLFRNHFKHIKHRIKHALKDNKKKNHQTPMSPGGTDKPTSPYENHGFEYDIDCRKGTLHSTRRTSSIDESMEKYVWLFDYSSGREAKWHLPKSLKLESEDRLPSKGHAMRSYRRNFSVPEMDSYCSLLIDDAPHSAMPIKTVVDYHEEDGCSNEQNLVGTPVDSAKHEPSDSVVGTKFKWNVVEGTDVEMECQSGLRAEINKSDGEIAAMQDQCESITEFATSQNIPQVQEQETDLDMNLTNELAQSTSLSVVSSCSSNDITSFAELPDSEGSEIDHGSIQIDEEHRNIDLQNRCDEDSASGLATPEKIQSASKILDNHLLHFEVDKNQEADFNYVKDILEFSGFLGNEHLDTWHSVDQPLNPTLFKDLEALLYSEDETIINCDHQLLFDLINEVLLDIYDVSLTYFPKAFSCNTRIRPPPIGHHLLEEVWTRIRHYLSLKPEHEGTLDCVVAQDLSKGRWMNLELETECVALELEELIFDELLDEIMCFPDC